MKLAGGLLKAIAVAVAVSAALPKTDAAIATRSTCRLTYVANAGVLFESGGAKFLVDTPVRGGIPPYAVPSAAVRADLEAARPPFDDVAAILVTHWHEDHFSAEAVAAHLAASPGTVLISSTEVVQRVRNAAPTLPASGFRPVTPEPGTSTRIEIGGVPVHVLRLRHSPTRRMPAEHVGFLLEGCRTVLHTGDADGEAGNFALLRDLPRVHVGLLPFWYLLGDPSREFVSRSIRPERMVGMHIPPQDAADARGRLAEIADLTLLVSPAQTVELRR